MSNVKEEFKTLMELVTQDIPFTGLGWLIAWALCPELFGAFVRHSHIALVLQCGHWEHFTTNLAFIL